VRRLAVICAAAAIIFGILTVRSAKQSRGVLAAGPQATATPTGSSSASKSTAGIVSASKVSVVASNVAARALALNPFDPNATIDLTTASAPNRVFALGVAAASGTPAANVRLIAIAGTGTAGSLGDGGAATSAQLNLISPSAVERSGIAVGTDGTIFLADSGNATIRAIGAAASSEPGVIRSIAGKWAPRQSVTLAEPVGIALDHAGNAFIADHAAGAVLALNLTNGELATLAHIASPASIAVTPNGGMVFVASPENGQVFAINTQTKAIDVAMGGAATSSNDVGTPQSGSACAGAEGVAPPQICPSGLAVDGAANLFVSDAASGRILRMDAKTGMQTTTASGLNQPGALAFDASGNLYVAEQGMNRIVAFAQAGAGQSNITISPGSAAFGNAPTGGATGTQQFTLSNTSSTTVTGLTIPKSTGPADFTVESNNCTVTLAASSSCTLNIAFTPTATGARSGSLTITDATSTDSATASLTGTGDDYEIQLAANQLTSLSVQTGAAATFNLQVVPDSVFSGTVALV
jgi:sugar lactone lactonase YvrE